MTAARSTTATSATVLGAVSNSGKRIELKAPTVNAKAGSTVDLRGGGDVLATEFVPGNGGDLDITLQANTYAIIPAAQLAAMPFDSHIQALNDPGFGFSLSSGRDAALYDSIQLGAGGAVPAGEYVLLPARYALLANAFLVQLQTGSAYRNLQAGQSTTLPNGQVVLAGFRSARGTSVRESQSVGVIVRPGTAAVRQASDYNFSGARFFADAATLGRTSAPRAPWDAGRLLIADATALTLYAPMAHLGLVIVPAGYVDPVLFAAGTPYGASTVSGNNQPPSDNEVAAAKVHGGRVAKIAAAIKSTRG